MHGDPQISAIVVSRRVKLTDGLRDSRFIARGVEKVLFQSTRKVIGRVRADRTDQNGGMLNGRGRGR